MEVRTKSQIFDQKGLSRTITRLSDQIAEQNPSLENIVIVGMQTRGVFLARRIAQKLAELENNEPPVGILDVSFYRDDYRVQLKQPNVQISNIPFSIDDTHVILVDDVLTTGGSLLKCGKAVQEAYPEANIVGVWVLVDRLDRGEDRSLEQEFKCILRAMFTRNDIL